MAQNGAVGWLPLRIIALGAAAAALLTLHMVAPAPSHRRAVPADSRSRTIGRPPVNARLGRIPLSVAAPHAATPLPAPIHPADGGRLGAPSVGFLTPLVLGLAVAAVAALLRPFAVRAAPWACLGAAGGRPIERRAVPLNLEGPEVPTNTFTKERPFTGVIVAKEKLGGPKALAETYHITIRTEGRIPCREGQCYGIIPPGMDVGADGVEKPHYPRLYTVATSRYGDSGDGQTTSLCVKKVAWWDAQLGGMKKELCSHFLCDAAPGTEVTMIGPTGGTMLLDENPEAVHICVATGTGIAPYRAFWRRLFYEHHPAAPFRGTLWLFFGGANPDELLYAEELRDLQATYPDQFKLVTAFADEEQTADGGKMFIQDKMAASAPEIFALLKDGAHLYCSGSKLMMPGITQMLEQQAAARGMDWAALQADLREAKRWHVEVY